MDSLNYLEVNSQAQLPVWVEPAMSSGLLQ
jgi:hypothetical protein